METDWNLAEVHELLKLVLKRGEELHPGTYWNRESLIDFLVALEETIDLQFHKLKGESK